MYTLLKKPIVVIVLIVSFIFSGFLMPKQASAQIGTPIGGLDLFLFPCTCTGGLLLWHLFAPLYIESVESGGGMVALSTPLLFSNYYLYPGSWALGTYFTGAGICLIGVEPYCYTLTALGAVSPASGAGGL